MTLPEIKAQIEQQIFDAVQAIETEHRDADSMSIVNVELHFIDHLDGTRRYPKLTAVNCLVQPIVEIA